MEPFIIGLLSGIAPCFVILIVGLIKLSERLAKIETNICWLTKEMSGCLLRSKDRTK